MKKLITIICAAMGIAAFGEATKYVNSNETLDITDDLSVDQFSVEAGTMIKDGGGAREIGGVRQLTAGGLYDGSDGLNIIISNGTITTKGPLAPIEDETLADTTLAKAYLHYDASVIESVVTNDDGIITKWKDLNGNHDAVVQPGTPTNRIARLNGLNTIDFCTYKLIDEWGNIDGSDTSHRAWMLFDRVAIRSGVIIFREIFPWDNSAFVIGDTQIYPFHRAQEVLINYWGDPTTFAAAFAEWRSDGMRINPLTYRMGTDYHLYSFRLDESTYTSTLCNDRDIRIGGAEIAEVAYFEEPLTDDELRAIEEKLLAKWFDKTHPAETSNPLKIDTLAFGDEAPVHAFGASVTPVIVDTLEADGSFVKNGDGDMTVNLKVGMTNLTVNGGSLTLKGGLKDILADAFIHLDPSDDSAITTNELGQILRMESVNGNGRYATPVPMMFDNKPTLAIFDGKPVIDCGQYGYGQGMNYTQSGLMFNERIVQSLREAFVVCYRDEGSGAFLLGDRNGGAYNFHADGDYILHTEFSMSGGDGSAVGTADWRINNVVINPSCTGFTNELAVYTVNGIDDRDWGTHWGGTVDRLGSDRDAYSIGGIKYGEVVLFDHFISEDDRTEIRNYLMNKWTDVKAEESVNELGSVVVAPNAHLRFGGNLALTNTESVLSVGIPARQDGAIEVLGKLILGKNPVLNLDSVFGLDATGTYPLIKADAIEGIDSVNDITLAGSGAGRYSCKLHLEGGVLSVTATKKGMTVIIR